MAKKLVFHAAKGGIGKTTSVQNIGAYFAFKGYRTLLIDIDPQANLTIAFDQDLLLHENNIIKVLRDRDFDGCIHQIKENLFLVPSHIRAESLNIEFGGLPSRELILRKALRKIEDDFDIIIIDPNTSLTILTYNALVAADSLYVPLKPGKFEMIGLSFLEEKIEEIKEDLNPKLEINGVFLTMVKKTNLLEEVEDILSNHLGKLFMKEKIRDNISVAEAPAACEDIFTHKSTSNGAKDYRELCEAICKIEGLD